jgi:hypothetical protein
MNLQIDHELKNLIRPLTFDERNGLQDNLIQNGCHDSIKTWNGIIVDGHNRYEICNEQGIEYKTDELAFDSKDDVKVWMIRQQLDKRNINDYTRTSLVLKMKEIFQKKAKTNLSTVGGDRKSEEYKESPLTKLSNPITPANTRKDIAKEAYVSEGTVAKVEYIENHATDKQKEDLTNSTKGVSIHSVYNELKKQEVVPTTTTQPSDAIQAERDADWASTCSYTPHLLEDDLAMCPCGCGYGYCAFNKKWYSKEEWTDKYV